MKGTRVASRYAKALLDLSIEKNSIDRINEDMLQLSILCKEKDLANLVKSPIIDGKKKVEIFQEIFGDSMDKMSLNFINLIVKNSRANLLPAIADSFIAHYKTHKNILDVYLVSAVALEKNVTDKILEKISKNFNGTIVLHKEIDPELVGGFIVRINDQQIDASIASKLTNLKNILLN